MFFTRRPSHHVFAKQRLGLGLEEKKFCFVKKAISMIDERQCEVKSIFISTLLIFYNNYRFDEIFKSEKKKLLL